jgi:3-(3-hydroxy-phenyl)propionate hydroxylase
VTIAGEQSWFLDVIADGGFTLLTFGVPAAAREIVSGKVKARVLDVGRDIADSKGLLARRFAAMPGTVYLLRPDQHVAARWRRFDETLVAAALSRAIGA